MQALDPRSKLLAAIILGALVVGGQSASRLLAVAAVVAVLIVVGRLGRALRKVSGALAPMVIITYVLSLWSYGPELAALTVVRFITLIGLFFVYFQTTLPEDLGNSLVQWRVPYAFAFILQGGMQFAPVMARRVESIVDAQRARGLLGRGIPWNAPSALFGPLLIQTFKLADELAEAMEARGFGAPQRTFLREYRWAAADLLVVGAALGVGVALWGV